MSQDLQIIQGALVGMEKKFESLLPDHVSRKKFLRLVVTAVEQNQYLMECNRESLYSAALKCAADGLLPDGREAALVPFKQRVSYIPMVAGILKKIRNSGELKDMSVGVVRKGEEFTHEISHSGEVLIHRPDPDLEDEEITRAYAIVRTKDGGQYIKVISRKQIEKIRSISAAGAKADGPWIKWYDEMAIKTAIRNLSKRLPMSTDLDGVIHADDEIFNPPTKDEPSPPAETQNLISKTKPSRLGKLVDSTPVPAAPSAPEEKTPEPPPSAQEPPEVLI